MYLHFGIYRNQKNDPNGSATRGLQNYDDLYADVLLWVNNGWVDYNIPQIYWEIGHPAADYDTLIRWWAKHSAARPLFIGQDVVRTVTKADLRIPSKARFRPSIVCNVLCLRFREVASGMRPPWWRTADITVICW